MARPAFFSSSRVSSSSVVLTRSSPEKLVRNHRFRLVQQGHDKLDLLFHSFGRLFGLVLCGVEFLSVHTMVRGFAANSLSAHGAGP